MLASFDLVTDYGDPQGEATQCRQHCALFDFSFVYRARVSGIDVIRKLEAFQPRMIGDMAVGQIRYSVKTDLHGRVRSDLTLWRFDEYVFEVMSGCEADIIELGTLQNRNFIVDDQSESTAILAIQGPETLTRLASCVDNVALRQLSYFHFTRLEVGGIACLVGRLGYSGEAGFELLVDRQHKEGLWSFLSAKVAPAGFAAIDILRIEAGFFLFTNECRIEPSINELGLSTLFAMEARIPEMRLVAFTADALADEDLTLWQPADSAIRRPEKGEIIVTSACFSPCFNSVLGLGFIASGRVFGSMTDPTAKFHNIELHALPPYDPHKYRPRSAWKDYPR
jgi:aminomethyltransferase